MSEGRSVMLSEAKKVSVEEEKRQKRLAKFMANRKKDRKTTMDKLRANRLKLNGLTPKSIGK